MIRVLQMVGSLNVGGSQAMLLNLYRNIDREKIQFDFVIDHPDQLYYAEEVKSMGARIYTVPRFNGINAGTVMRAWDKLFTEHPEYKVFHTHVPSYAAMFLHVAKKHGLKTLAHGHTASNGDGLVKIIKTAMQFPVRYQVDVRMACSDKAAEALFGKNTDYVFLPNAVDIDRFAANAETREKYRREMGIDDKYVVGHVGRLSEAKNHKLLIDAFAELLEKRNDAHLLLVGDGELRGEIESRIHELKIEDHVTMTGNRNDVAELMQAMDIFAFPSLWEGLPVTLVEAQTAGLPCVISDTISKDVDVSPLIKRLPIDSSDVWAEELAKEHEKMNVTEQVRNAGFDVRVAVRTLTELYMKLGGTEYSG